MSCSQHVRAIIKVGLVSRTIISSYESVTIAVLCLPSHNLLCILHRYVHVAIQTGKRSYSDQASVLGNCVPHPRKSHAIHLPS